MKGDRFEQMVDAVLGAFIDPLPRYFSDDIEDYYAKEGVETPQETYLKEVGKRIERQNQAREELMRTGAEALPAVRKGLRHTKYTRGREVLLEFMKKHGGEDADKEMLRLISVRQRDTLAKESRKLLASWGVDISGLYPKPRSTLTPTEIEYEDKLARLVETCRQPTKVRDLMKELGLSNRRHFSSHYLVELWYVRKLVAPSAYTGPLRDCYQITAKGMAWLEQRSR